MTSESYAKYYAKNREMLIEKMRGRYNPERKHEYYEQHKEEMKNNMAVRYRQLKGERNRQIINEILASNPTDSVRQRCEALLEGDEYKDVHKRTLDFLRRQVSPATA